MQGPLETLRGHQRPARVPPAGVLAQLAPGAHLPVPEVGPQPRVVVGYLAGGERHQRDLQVQLHVAGPARLGGSPAGDDGLDVALLGDIRCWQANRTDEVWS